jgi:hypothetical protein
MINHISIGVHNPEKVANVLAELWNGMVLPFPPCPNSFIVVANDGRGSAVEITPIDTVLVPGEGLPPEENFDINVRTEEYEAKFIKSGFTPQYVATHLNINTHLSEAEIKAIGARRLAHIDLQSRRRSFSIDRDVDRRPLYARSYDA